ncbi:hypothetical protein ACFP1I_07565 [Dyadobacter subterraneus]|uniref:Sortilin N-terminal domain-containing protein n=1 Tax=Dyadobacter subterraneus TaxID=2773304 RepID=A0ABR9WET5_9BACT|nr:hypothetical protein [Dyadobacter subterraneus]MBE9464010.1 hypothetical protein [Dyadobacter subterraneus]
MKIFLYCFLLIVTLSCNKPDSDVTDSSQDTVLDEYPDWYTLKSPDDHMILGVWGNYNKTVVISTGAKLFRTDDQGKHWKKVLQLTAILFGVVQYQDTLFAMNGLSNQTKQAVYQQVLTTADHYSVDDGKSWKRYSGSNHVLYDIPEFESADKFLINPVFTPDKDTYKINMVFKNGPDATTGGFTTPGVITSNGRRIDLPQLHQLQSLFLDDQQRLYIACSDAVCGSENSFKFCNSQGGRGVVYISKKPLPR